MKVIAYLSLLAALLGVKGISGCSFQGLLANCHITVGGYPLQASARINHCHNPIDITFLIQSSHDYSHLPQGRRQPPIIWQYTYVTSGQPESLEIPGSNRRIFLHLVGNSNITRKEHGLTAKVIVKAHFLIDGHATSEGDLKFLDETVRIPHFEDCLIKQAEDSIGKIVLALVASFILLCTLCLVCLWVYHQKRGRGEDEQGLVSHMERSHSSPNKRNPATTPSKDVEQEKQKQPPPEASIHYVVPNKESSSKDNTEEPKVFVSTPNGLQRVQHDRKPAPPKRESSKLDSDSLPPPLPPKGLTTDPLGVQVLGPENNYRKEPLSPSSSVRTSDSSSSDQSLGAIPKRKLVAPNGDIEASPSSSSASSFAPPSR